MRTIIGWPLFLIGLVFSWIGMALISLAGEKFIEIIEEKPCPACTTLKCVVHR